MWEEAAAELVPAKSLARIDERARQVVTGVGLVAALLTRPWGDHRRPTHRHRPRHQVGDRCHHRRRARLGGGVGGAAGPAPTPQTTWNLAQIEAWYRREFTRAWWILTAGTLTVLAVLLAGTAAITVLAVGAPDQPAVSLRLAGVGTDTTATARVTFPDLDPATIAHADLTGTTADGTRTVLARETTIAGAAGTATIDLTVKPVAGYTTITLDATTPRWRCTATQPTTASGPAPTAACTRR